MPTLTDTEICNLLRNSLFFQKISWKCGLKKIPQMKGAAKIHFTNSHVN